MADAVEEPAIEANSWGESDNENADVEPSSAATASILLWWSVLSNPKKESQTYLANGIQ